jgi:hypothetical protein
MTKTEAILRAALLQCQAQLQLNAKLLNDPKIDEAIGVAAEALAAKVTPIPVFEASNEYVRGPARPEGSGYKQMVFKLPNQRSAQMTVDSLNSLFAVHCKSDNPELSLKKHPDKAIA